MARRVNYDKKWVKKSKDGEKLFFGLLKIIALVISLLSVFVFNLLKFLYGKLTESGERKNNADGK